MKTKNIIVGTLIFLFINPIWGQNKSQKLNYLSIGLTPLNLIDPYTPTLEGTIEVQVNNQVNLEAKYGLHFDMRGYFFDKENLDEKGKYYKVKFGVKYLTRKNDGHPGYSTGYIGLEYFILEQDYVKTNSSLERNGITYSYSLAEINKSVNALRLKYGLMVIGVKNKWDIDIYTGLGIRRTVIKHNTVSETRSFFRPRYNFFR